jgi:hypothetical protein
MSLSLEQTAYAAFRNGSAVDWRAYAADQIRRRGIGPIRDAIAAKLERAHDQAQRRAT